MNRYALGVALLMLVFEQSAFAVVRTITVDEGSMAEIHLAMGRSTVLHFHEKPTKVVAGNQNYFNIEFTGSDITIQPLGPITSNLFAYGEYHRYGFILRVSGGGGYDDLVQVRWRSSTLLSPLTSAPSATSVPPSDPQIHAATKQVSTKNIQLKLTKAFYEKAGNLYVIELEIKDATGAGITSKNVGIAAVQNQKSLPLREVIFDRDASDKKNPILKARIFVAIPDKKPIMLKVDVQGKKAQMPVPRSFLR